MGFPGGFRATPAGFWDVWGPGSGGSASGSTAGY